MSEGSPQNRENFPQNREITGKVGFGNPPENHRFQKGQSGNPSGRPKGLAKAVRETPEKRGAGDAAELLAALWWNIASDPNEDTRDRLFASRMLAERGWGKPAQFVPIEEGDPLEMSEAETAQLAAELDAAVDEIAAKRAERDLERIERERQAELEAASEATGEAVGEPSEQA